MKINPPSADASLIWFLPDFYRWN